MRVREMLRAGAQEVARDVFSTWNGRFALGVILVVQVIDWAGDDQPWWALLIRLALAPVWLLALLACLQFLSGALFALIHARRPKHSYVVLDLKDGRQRRGLLCKAPCCVRREIKAALRSGGGVKWMLDDRSDDELFKGDEIERWAVMPVDDPDPHGKAVS